jgi:hypothetical protein
MSAQGFNIATASGWLAQYDYWAKKFGMSRWCDMAYAYKHDSGPHQYGNIVPRGTDRAGIALITPWEHLNDAGKRHRLQVDRQQITEYSKSLMRAIEYGCAGEKYLGVEEARQILECYGLPMVEQEVSYDSYFSGTVYFSTTEQVRASEIDFAVLQKAIFDAMGETLDKVLGKATGYRAKGTSYGSEMRSSFGANPIRRIRKFSDEEIAATLGGPPPAVTAAS